MSIVLFWSTLFLAGLALVAGGCASIPTPEILLEPGVKIAALQIQKDVIADFGKGEGVERIMNLGWDDGQLRIITEKGIRWITGPTASDRSVSFANRMFQAIPITTDSGLRVIGLSGGRDVPIVRLDGTTDKVLRGDSYRLPMAGNVLGDAASEILLPTRQGVRIYAPDGRIMGFVASPWIASDRTFVQADNDWELEIVFMRPMGNRSDVRVVNGDGTLVADWTVPHRTWLSFVPELGSGLLWGVTDEGFVAFSSLGQVVQGYPADTVGYLRDVAGSSFGDYTVLIASGNGYRGRSVLAMYDRNARLMYYEVFGGRTYAVTSHPSEPTLFVGAGEKVMRYRIVSP